MHVKINSVLIKPFCFSSVSFFLLRKFYFHARNTAKKNMTRSVSFKAQQNNEHRFIDTSKSELCKERERERGKWDMNENFIALINHSRLQFGRAFSRRVPSISTPVFLSTHQQYRSL